ncbi:HAD family hydrolase [Burkholderia thailandensis]|uniref:HAD hydrolase, IA, variant 3 family protein n=1 Tax=Burkholderia thailandensis TaxID=57975 RepID=A0AAW9D601_BURTH|nr:HAD family phosphatase [Burkholderia thailandensis]AHI63702.1 HAD hydrolase, IA, variant 3 family protein [Burkholderia thailandensis H0587]AIP63776.1 HAD family hydrolase [Burkholderia thailandensis]AOI52795.1 HAD family hydrolase [Burkholderia thailandensis]AOJ51790.1 HAD family hydrolase [Burkholderia thailandensis]AVR24131.1 HAD family phosphatase [Burkholderia thailandensis]
MTAHAHDARALVCDCDGVLIDSEAIAADVLVRELEARWPGVAVRPIVMPLLGLRTERVLGCASEHTGRALADSDVEAIRRSVEAAAVQAPVVDGIDAALARIDLTIACASNSRRHYVDAALRRTGLKRFFGERLFCADGVARPKPAPDVYLAAAHALGVAPSRCLVVEDSATGVTAASAAGMTVLGFVGGGHASPRQVDALRGIGARRVFDDMRELPGLVARWVETGALDPH